MILVKLNGYISYSKYYSPELSCRVCETHWIIPDIGIEVRVTRFEFEGIMADKTTQGRTVVSGSVVVQPGTIVFSSRILERVRTGRACGSCRPERLISVMSLKRSISVEETQCRTQGIEEQDLGATRR